MRSVKNWASAAALVALAGTAQAALINQGNGTVLDTATNLLWLQDWSSSARLNWNDAGAWAAGLTAGGGTAGDWRLPSLDEFMALWADVGSSTTGLNDNFSAVQFHTVYWSATESSLFPGAAIGFQTSFGTSYTTFNTQELYAVAVRPADVAAAVPEPQTLALALLALSAAMAARRRRPC